MSAQSWLAPDANGSYEAVGINYDNAAAESFFGVLKRERVNRRHYLTRADARADIIDYIERFHNQRKRRKPGKNRSNRSWLSVRYIGVKPLIREVP